MYNLIETTNDESPIIDTKGIIVGKLAYNLTFDILDSDRETKLNLLDFETLNDALGKYVTLNIDLKQAYDIPERYSYQTKAQYKWWNERDDCLKTTRIVERKKDPDFNFKSSINNVLITEELIQYLIHNTMTVGVYGMIESKKAPIIKRKAVDQTADTTHPGEQEYES